MSDESNKINTKDGPAGSEVSGSAEEKKAVDLFGFRTFTNMGQFEAFYVLRPIVKLLYDVFPDDEDNFVEEMNSGNHYTIIENPDIPGEVRILHAITAEKTELISATGNQ